MTHPLVERLTERAEELFAGSNDRRAAEWSRKALGSAWAGMVNAIHLVEAWLAEQHGAA